MANPEKQYIQFSDGAVIGVNRRIDGVLEIEVDGAMRGTVVGWEPTTPEQQEGSSPTIEGSDNQEGAINANSD